MTFGQKCGFLLINSTLGVRWSIALEGAKYASNVKVQDIWVDKRSIARAVEEVAKWFDKLKLKIKLRKCK